MVKIINPGNIGEVFSGSFVGAGDQILLWLGYGVISTVIIGIMILFYIILQYKYRVDIIKVEGKGVSKRKFERAKPFNLKGVKKWRLLMRRKDIKPVPFEYIDRNKVTLLQGASDVFIPVKEKLEIRENDGEKVLVKSLIPIDEDIQFWYQMQQQQIAEDYQPDDISKKQMYMMIGTIIFCLALCGFTIWLSLKSGQDVATALRQVKETPLLQQVAQGVAPR